MTTTKKPAAPCDGSRHAGPCSGGDWDKCAIPQGPRGYAKRLRDGDLTDEDHEYEASLKKPAAPPPSPLREVTIGHRTSSMSWKFHQEGYAEVRASRHDSADWISLSIKESFESDKGRAVGKYASITLMGDERKRFLDVVEDRRKAQAFEAMFLALAKLRASVVRFADDKELDAAKDKADAALKLASEVH